MLTGWWDNLKLKTMVKLTQFLNTARFIKCRAENLASLICSDLSINRATDSFSNCMSHLIVSPIPCPILYHVMCFWAHVWVMSNIIIFHCNFFACSADPLSNMCLTFNTKEAAINYAEKHGNNLLQVYPKMQK